MSLQGFLLEHKPEDAAAVIQVLNQVPAILCACYYCQNPAHLPHKQTHTHTKKKKKKKTEVKREVIEEEKKSSF